MSRVHVHGGVCWDPSSCCCLCEAQGPPTRRPRQRPPPLDRSINRSTPKSTGRLAWLEAPDGSAAPQGTAAHTMVKRPTDTSTHSRRPTSRGLPQQNEGRPPPGSMQGATGRVGVWVPRSMQTPTTHPHDGRGPAQCFALGGSKGHTHEKRTAPSRRAAHRTRTPPPSHPRAIRVRSGPWTGTWVLGVGWGKGAWTKGGAEGCGKAPIPS